MRIICISDTHQMHHDISVPDGDVLVCAGDFTGRGHPLAIRDFAEWIHTLPFEHKLVIAGNHDLLFETHPDYAQHILKEAAPDTTYLQDSGISIDGVKFWGSPWQPRFHDWAFNIDRYSPELAAKWAQIPNDTDVLITHGPPYGFLDECVDGRRVGCEVLIDRITSLNLKYHIFGHIHESYGVHEMPDDTTFVNASICTEYYTPTNEPIVVEI